jgi:hypothetical protein
MKAKHIFPLTDQGCLPMEFIEWFKECVYEEFDHMQNVANWYSSPLTLSDFIRPDDLNIDYPPKQREIDNWQPTYLGDWKLKGVTPEGYQRIVNSDGIELFWMDGKLYGDTDEPFKTHDSFIRFCSENNIPIYLNPEKEI